MIWLGEGWAAYRYRFEVLLTQLIIIAMPAHTRNMAAALFSIRDSWKRLSKRTRHWRVRLQGKPDHNKCRLPIIREDPHLRPHLRGPDPASCDARLLP